MYICGKEFNFFFKTGLCFPEAGQDCCQKIKVLHVVLLMQIMHIRIERFALNYLEELSNCEIANLF